MALSGEFALEGAIDLSKDRVGEDVPHGSVPSGTHLNNEPLWKPEILCTQLTLLCSVFTSGLILPTLLNIISLFSLYECLSSFARNSDLCFHSSSNTNCTALVCEVHKQNENFSHEKIRSLLNSLLACHSSVLNLVFESVT